MKKIKQLILIDYKIIINLFVNTMEKSILVILAILGVATIGLYNLESFKSESSEELFKAWQMKNNKIYEDTAQYYYRLQTWISNLEYVSSHNAKYYAGLQTYQLQMNLFADLSSQQFGAKHLGYKKNVQVTSKCTGKQAPTINLPSQVDWTSKGAVTPIKNQGQCGSCWAFSTTGSLEGAKFIATQKLSSYSEQQLVDCSGSYGNKGCNGGLMDMAFYYVKDNGITLEDSYPYKGVGGSCQYNSSSDKAWTISDCTDVQINKQLPLKAAISQQPVSVAIQANHLSFQLYKKGVYSGACGTNLDHGVLAVGYGALDGKNYWKVKNSWGAAWGTNGYILIARNGDGKGQCGIQEAASFPIA